MQRYRKSREGGQNLHLSAQSSKDVTVKQLVCNAGNSLFGIICDSNVVLEHDAAKCRGLFGALREAEKHRTQITNNLMLDSSRDHKTVSIRSKDGNCDKKMSKMRKKNNASATWSAKCGAWVKAGVGLLAATGTMGNPSFCKADLDSSAACDNDTFPHKTMVAKHSRMNLACTSRNFSRVSACRAFSFASSEYQGCLRTVSPGLKQNVYASDILSSSKICWYVSMT
jgi:hypothetical protein